MATLFKQKKKTKPKIIEIKEFIDESTDETTSGDQNATNSERTRILSDSRTDSHVVTINDSPSAPPEDQYEYRVTGLANPDIRANFMAKVYGVLFLQKVSFTTMIAIFTFVPHLRKVVRKTVFDPLFMNSFIGYPLFIVPLILMAIFPTIRRKLATWAFIILTLCLSLLISYAITTGATANAFLYSMGVTNLCDLGVIVGSKRKLDFTKWRYICLTPAVMIGSSILAPTLLKSSLNNTIWSSIATTAGSTYLAANTVPVIRHNDLNLKSDEHVFAAMQLYLNPEQYIRHKIYQWFCGERERERTGYTPIR